MGSTRIIAEMQDDQTLTVSSTKSKKINLPPFHGIGGNTEMTTQIKGYDNLYEVLQNLSKKATWMWWGLLRVRVLRTNKCILVAKDNVEAKKISAAYKELKGLDLIVRVSKQLYMVNPIAMLPEFKFYPEVQEEWNNIS